MNFNKSFEYAIYNIEESNQKDFQNLDWKSISAFRNLSDDFINAYSEYLDWGVICTHQKLSENMMRRYSHKINYNAIGITQINQMSIEFILENKKSLNMKSIRNCKKYWSNPQLKCSYFYKEHINEFQDSHFKTKFIDEMLIDFVKKETDVFSLKSMMDINFPNQEI